MTDKIDPKKVKSFLEDLNDLSLEHGIFIAGCGCCDSPYLTTNRNGHGRYVLQEQDGCLTWKEYT